MLSKLCWELQYLIIYIIIVSDRIVIVSNRIIPHCIEVRIVSWHPWWYPALMFVWINFLSSLSQHALASLLSLLSTNPPLLSMKAFGDTLRFIATLSFFLSLAWMNTYTYYEVINSMCPAPVPSSTPDSPTITRSAKDLQIDWQAESDSCRSNTAVSRQIPQIYSGKFGDTVF